MIIEDDPVIQNELQILLSGNGYDVVKVEDFSSTVNIALILLVWFPILTAYLLKAYFGRGKQMDKLMDLVWKLEERYLISDVMEKPDRADDQVYYQVSDKGYL